MRLIRTEDAAGHVLCHDMTQIIPGVTKDARFRKGHVVTEEDIPVLLSIGKEHLYVWEKTDGMLHEDEGAERLRKIAQNENMHPSEVKEGKIELIADIDGLFQVDVGRLYDVNSVDEIMTATRHTNMAVRKGDKLAGMRVIPLVIDEKQLEEAERTLEMTHKMLLDSGVDAETISKGGKVLEKAVDDVSRKAYIEYRSALTYRTFVMKRRDMKYISSALQAAKPMLLKDIADFDSQEFLLNTPTATYDLQKGVHGGRPHNPEDYLTKMTAVSPNNVGEEIWKDALHCFFCGDQSLTDYVQQICGLCAIGKVYQEALIIAYGEGSNGKSTFWNAISRVLGSYSGTMSADALTVGCKRNVKPEMAELKGKRLVIAAELEEGMRLNTAVIKQLCSTDEIQAEKKYKDPFRYTPAHTLVLYTNHLPRVGANDAGTWRRLIVIPFLAKLEGKSDIKNFADYLVEHAGGAILSWVMEGAKQVIDRQFKLEVPQCVKKAIHAYRESNDWMSAFLEDCCDVDKTYQQKSGELYQEYRSYCSRNGEYTRSTTDFYTGLENAGFERKRTKKGVIVYGLKIKSEFLE